MTHKPLSREFLRQVSTQVNEKIAQADKIDRQMNTAIAVTMTEIDRVFTGLDFDAPVIDVWVKTGFDVDDVKNRYTDKLVLLYYNVTNSLGITVNSNADCRWESYQYIEENFGGSYDIYLSRN